MITYTIKADNTIILHKHDLGDTHFALTRKQFFELNKIIKEIEHLIYKDIGKQMLKNEQKFCSFC